MRRLATLALLATASLAGCDGEEKTTTTVTVMSRNLYLGADLAPLSIQAVEPYATEADLKNIIDGVVWPQVVASDIPERAALLAAEIDAEQPDLVGLQEVSKWYLSADTTVDESDVEYDFLALLLAALPDYEVATDGTNQAVFQGFSAQLTGNASTYRYEDRDVILVRKELDVRDVAEGAFEQTLPFPVAFLSTTPTTPPGTACSATGFPAPLPPVPSCVLPVSRGWVSLDASKGGVDFHFVNTHLEAFNALVRGAQALELVDVVASPLPLVLVGDLNSDPSAPTFAAVGVPGEGFAYDAITAASTGIDDAWLRAGSGDGLTCCYDADVADPAATLTQRIDLVLVRGYADTSDVHVNSIRVLGTDYDTATSHWPSDHAGVVAELDISQQE